MTVVKHQRAEGDPSFLAELERYGPAADAAVAIEAARAYTRRLAETHYENFPVLSRFVPSHLRQHFANIYAYCRWSDDLGDEVGDPDRSLSLFDWWESELARCYGGTPRHPVMVALAETIQAFDIPRGPFEDLVAAFRRDQVQHRYATFAELLDYCRGSANPVGRLVLYLVRRPTKENFHWSDQICTGLQLANFWQDVAIDWDKGRVYLPQEDLARFGVGEADLGDRRFTPAFRDLMAFEVARAESYLRAGLPLARRMPGRLRLVIALFAHGGLRILAKIRAAGFDVLARRPRLSKFDLAAIVPRALLGLVWPMAQTSREPLAAGRDR